MAASERSQRDLGRAEARADAAEEEAAVARAELGSLQATLEVEILQKPGPGTVGGDELEARIAAAVAGESLLALIPVNEHQGREKMNQLASDVV